MQLVLTRDAEAFAHRAKPVLEGRIECNLIATVLMTVLDGFHTRALFAYAVDEGGTVRTVALRTPPWPLLASDWAPGCASALVSRWLEEDPVLPGVSAPPQTARAIAAAWAAETGGATECRMREALHVLREVEDPPHQSPGSLRVARRDDRALLIEWMRAFIEELGLTGADRADAMVDSRLQRGSLLVWDDGEAVSMLGVGQPVAGVVRIGPVYTPPERRRRGYAGNAVAATSRRALAQGATACMLFTDLSNSTSNKIYAEVGYRRAGDWEEHRFTPA